MMKTHFSEADLLDTYYMQPGESASVMLHLAGCTDCMNRYARLERKLREAAACPSQKPDTFWSRQRLSIIRRIAARPRALRVGSAARVAAAALLAFVMGGAVVYHEVKPAPATAPAVVAKAPTVDEMHGPINPWESDELKQYHDVVQWESWVAETTENGGDNSL